MDVLSLPRSAPALIQLEANDVCKRLLFQHLITDSPNRSLMNAASGRLVHVCAAGGWEYGMGNRQRWGWGGKNEKGLIWFGSGEVIIPFPHFTAQP